MVLEMFYSLPFKVLEQPHLKLKKPNFIRMPSAMTVFGIAMVSYFLVTGGEWKQMKLFGGESKELKLLGESDPWAVRPWYFLF